MSKSQSNSGTVDVDGATYDWHLQREPHQSDDEGWKGMTIALLQRDAKREARMEFPAPKRLLRVCHLGDFNLMMQRSRDACAPPCRLVGSRCLGVSP
jgi:hypothetical protein